MKLRDEFKNALSYQPDYAPAEAGLRKIRETQRDAADP